MLITNIFLILVVFILFLLFLMSIPGKLTGKWVEDDARDKPPIILARIGPFVRGKRKMEGGIEVFSGLYFNKRLRLKRFDYGLDLLKKKGFPEAIAKKVEGTVVALYKFKLTSKDRRLIGEIMPQKIHFTYRPPRITDRYFLKGTKKEWEKIL